MTCFFMFLTQNFLTFDSKLSPLLNCNWELQVTSAVNTLTRAAIVRACTHTHTHTLLSDFLLSHADAAVAGHVTRNVCQLGFITSLPGFYHH